MPYEVIYLRLVSFRQLLTSNELSLNKGDTAVLNKPAFLLHFLGMNKMQNDLMNPKDRK